MPRFFSDEIESGRVFLRGEDARHIQKSLRMQVGDPLTVCDLRGIDLTCRIEEISPDLVTAAILERRPSETEPTVRVRLYQALPKGDKLDLIVQKAVELGACEIIPVLTSRCISRPDGKSMEKKIQRLSRIALEAAKQCGRGIVPKVGALHSWEAALSEMGEAPLAILFYEEATASLREMLQGAPGEVSILIGAEGGFSREEVKEAKAKGLQVASLGKRILRCETAPMAALSVLMYETGNL